MTGLVIPVISCSLDPESRSRGLAERSAKLLRDAGHQTILLDLRDYPLPSFDNSEIFHNPAFTALHDVISKADNIILAMPIYNWGPSAAVKNLIEATGATGDDMNTAAWFDKVVTFLCSAGLPHSYMATSQLASSLMLDFKCIINPYIGYFNERDWDQGSQLTQERNRRLTKTLAVHVELSQRLAHRDYQSSWEV